MKLNKLIYLFFLLSFFQKGLSQSTTLFENIFTEKTTDQDKFLIYLDSIDKYLYRDLDLTNLAFIECQKIIDQGVLLSDSIQFDYVLAKIYFQYSLADPLGAYQIIVDNVTILNNKKLSKKQIGSFNYIKGFTYMSIGDLEGAQKVYYQEIERGKINKDTGSIVRNLYSLGQLYNDEKDFEASISSFQKVINDYKTFKLRASTEALIYLELSEPYTNTKKYDQALEALQSAFEISEKHQMEILKSDVLMLKGNVYLAQNKIDSAEYIYKELLKSNSGKQDQNNIDNSQKFLAQIYRAKKMYPQALALYKDILEKTDSSAIDNILETYANAHEASKEMNKFESAYDYLLAFNKAKSKKDEDVKRQKTAYLKIKYNSEQKEKDNIILAAEISHNRAERKLLYGWIALSGLFLIILIGAFYQKGRYSKKLENEVLKRTINLQKSNDLLYKSNKELDEFNRILSHDLLEPLRSIVGFSQLASRDITNTTKVQEYLGFVSKGGKQLKQLIEDVDLFRKTNSINTTEITPVDIQELLYDIVLEVQEKYPRKKINLMCPRNSTIIGSIEVLKPVFQILIDNATKYNEQKIVAININYELKDQTHFFEIEDNGIGISQKYHLQVFEMFKRLNNRTNYTGSGLGLSITQRLMERIEGKISILRSQENEGSTFLISFPELTTIHKETADLVTYQ